jgi:hypothetical protein
MTNEDQSSKDFSTVLTTNFSFSFKFFFIITAPTFDPLKMIKLKKKKDQASGCQDSDLYM